MPLRPPSPFPPSPCRFQWRGGCGVGSRPDLLKDHGRGFRGHFGDGGGIFIEDRAGQHLKVKSSYPYDLQAVDVIDSLGEIAELTTDPDREIAAVRETLSPGGRMGLSRVREIHKRAGYSRRWGLRSQGQTLDHGQQQTV